MEVSLTNIADKLFSMTTSNARMVYPGERVVWKKACGNGLNRKAMMYQVERYCPRCQAPRPWEKFKPEGAKASRRKCIVCGGTTHRIKHKSKKVTMPTGLFTYRQKVKQANELWRHLIYRKSPNGICCVCGKKKGLQAMHIFPKGKYPHIRFEVDNGFPGCQGCHMQLTNDHERHKQEALKFLGTARYEWLRLRSISRSKNDIDLTILYLQSLTDRPVGSEPAIGPQQIG